MSQTLKNLVKAYVGECQARNRYTFFAKVARDEGFEQIAAIFLETADQEKEHAKKLFLHIQELKENDDNIKVEFEAPTVFEDTKTNLGAAAAGETYEETEMYPEFANIAEKEGFTAIAKRMRAIAQAERHHKERYLVLLKQLENETLFKKEEEVEWVCRECGYVHKGTEPPQECPSCNHSKAFYQLRCEEY